MKTSEQLIGMAEKLYSARRSVKFILADKYDQRMSEIGKFITAASEQWKCDVLAAAIRMCKDGTVEPMIQMQIMAAAVELLEPSGVPE